jgi:hypothetical protein
MLMEEVKAPYCAPSPSMRLRQLTPLVQVDGEKRI